MIEESNKRLILFFTGNLFLLIACQSEFTNEPTADAPDVRQRLSINDDWRFMKYASSAEPDDLVYDIRPNVEDHRDDKDADSKPTESIAVVSDEKVLKPWILPTGNDFIKNPAKRYSRPEENPGEDFAYVQANFDDSSWETVDLPHDWAIKGPFFAGWDVPVGGGMGRLPSPGVAWYRKQIWIPARDKGKSIFLDVDGAMSYAMVWVNGKLAGGWPYGYSSWRIDLTPYLNYGEENQLAIRLDNPPNSSRWYPGGGIYRNVWLVKTNPVHVSQWGTFLKTREASEASATVEMEVMVDNDSRVPVIVKVLTEVYDLNEQGEKTGPVVGSFAPVNLSVEPQDNATETTSLIIEAPRLWGPPPTQTPHRYLAITRLVQNDEIIDTYETPFGIRSLEFDPNKGVFINGEHIFLKGVNQHHDLGALGAAFNTRAAERQLKLLREMGCNAIRMAHNPPAPELLESTDRMGFLVIDELFDCWERKKTPLDFHLIFPDWHEQDLRAWVRRDRNSPSVILWSTGNEVGEQYTGEEGAAIARRLREIVNEEDATRPTSASMNYAKPDMAFSEEMEVINLNYQGEGIRDADAYAHLRNKGITTPPLYPAFHSEFPEKVIISSENAAALSSRGTYVFPVHEEISAPVSDSTGGDPKNAYVSAYELYTAPFGASADKVFASIDRHPFVAGGFVWSGWDYLGEPTPYYSSRSSYYGVIDLAGFKKDRFYLYQSRWRPELPMAHILPHWNWPDRIGQITPVHVFTSGDEAELYLNGKSLGRKKKAPYQYRLRWDDVNYEPGELHVVAYKNGNQWAEERIQTTGAPAQLQASADRNEILADGKDLAFITVRVADQNELTVPDANSPVKFDIEGPGEIVATDNGDPTNLVAFPSPERTAFNGLVLVIIRSRSAEPGAILITAQSPGLNGAQLVIQSQ